MFYTQAKDEGFHRNRDAAPRRHGLRLIDPEHGGRILFTYDRFRGVESLPQPGPIYVHAEECLRYAEDGGIPEELRGSPRTLEGYALGPPPSCARICG